MIEDVHNVCTRNGKTQKGNIIWSVNNPLLHGRVTNALKKLFIISSTCAARPSRHSSPDPLPRPEQILPSGSGRLEQGSIL